MVASAFRGYRRAPAARFDASSQHRRSLMAKVQIAKKELGICDDDYRAILIRLANGKMSSADCSDAELIAVLDEFKAKGWQAKPRADAPKAADHKAAMKARAMWISLHHLCAIDDPSEKALEAFGKRQLGCDRLQWADQSQMFKLIEALKAIGGRHGWDFNTISARDGSHALKVQKVRLLDAILTKLKASGFAAEGWNLAGAAIHIAGFEKARSCGPMSWELGELDMLARTFGNVLRTGERNQS